MRLLSLRHDGNDTIAVRKDDGVYDLRVVAPDLPAALDLLMSSGTDWLARAHKAAAQVTEVAKLSETDVTYRPVLERPGIHLRRPQLCGTCARGWRGASSVS